MPTITHTRRSGLNMQSSGGKNSKLPGYALNAGKGSVSAIIPTNVKASMPDDEVLMLYIRSSIGIKHHVTLANGTGIIDADYFSNPDNDGNIGICLQNNSDEIVSFKKGERIMQGIFVKYAVCDSDDTNEVRKGGFGSTGKE